MHFLTTLTSGPGKQMVLSDGSIDGPMQGLNSLILNFSNYYCNNVSFQSSTFVEIMLALITKITDRGFNNPPLWND